MLRTSRQSAGSSAAGAVLLEVVLALTLFVSGAAVIGAGLNQCLNAAYRLRTRTEAADLAVTLISEIQMGKIAPVTIGATAYDDEQLADWTWKMTAEQMDDVPDLLLVTVTVTHEPSGVFYRLTEWMEM